MGEISLQGLSLPQPIFMLSNLGVRVEEPAVDRGLHPIDELGVKDSASKFGVLAALGMGGLL